MKKYVRNFKFKESCEPYSAIIRPGIYLFEAWGASGGGKKSTTGKGGYTSGILTLNTILTLKIYVGGKGEDPSNEKRIHNGGCNGGGNGGAPYSTQYSSGAGGGGATDFRLNENYQSRILVAGGGGGEDGPGGGNNGGTGAPGGGIYSGNLSNFDITIQGGTQTYGTEDGIGQNGRSGMHNSGGSEGNGGCGGGYRGGTTHSINKDNSNIGGSGGSSYISGHPYCSQYGSFIFTNPTVQIGTEYFLDPNNNLETGHFGNGHARITQIFILTHKNCKKNYNSLFLINIMCSY